MTRSDAIPTAPSLGAETGVHSYRASFDSSSRHKAHWMSLLGDFTWTLLGNGVFAACQWGIIVVLAKMLNAVAVGSYSLSQAILVPILTFTAFQLRGVIASDIRGDFTNREYFGFRTVTLAVGVAVATAVAVVIPRSAQLIGMVSVLGLIQSAELTSDALYGFQQRSGNLVRPAISMIVKGLIGLGALTAGIYWGKGVIPGLWALFATRVAVLISYDLRNSLGPCHAASGPKRAYFNWSRHYSILKVVYYIGIMAVLSAWISIIPRYFIEANLGSRELGVFTAIYSLTGVGLMPVAALGLAAFVRLARTFAFGPTEQFLKILGALVGLSIAIGACGLALAYLAGPQILTILFRPEYAAYTELFKLTMMIGAITLLSASLGATVTAARIFKPQVKLLAIVGIAETLGCWILVPRAGLTGAALACLGAALIQFGGTAFILAFEWRRRTPMPRMSAAQTLS